MKKINRKFVYSFIIMSFALILTNACKKDDDKETNPVVDRGINFNQNLTYGILTDIDGNEYKTITIGSQTWMAENLRVTHYRNGSPIINIQNYNLWENTSTGAYSTYENNSLNAYVYGNLYNYNAVINPQGLCPEGWHVSSKSDWEKLISNYLFTTSMGTLGEPAKFLRETGSVHWFSPNSAHNQSGFTALPGGLIDYKGLFSGIREYGMWWSGTETDSLNATSFYIHYNRPDVQGFSDTQKKCGLSIRCVKD